MSDFIYKAINDSDFRIEENERAIVHTISTSSIDHDNEILVARGVILDEFKQKGVPVLWSHDATVPPVGKPQWVKLDKANDRVIAKTVFADTEFANNLYELYKGKFITGWSVGFHPDKSEYREPNKKELNDTPNLRRVWEKWYLLEYSAVNIPANTEARTIAVGKGLINKTNCKFFQLTEEDVDKISFETRRKYVKVYPIVKPSGRVVLSDEEKSLLRQTGRLN